MSKLNIKLDFPTFSSEERVIDWIRKVNNSLDMITNIQK